MLLLLLMFIKYHRLVKPNCVEILATERPWPENGP
jgi:hypothetical protein